MDVRVLVATTGPQQPDAGLPVTVELRDTSQLDVASTTVCSASTVTGQVEDAAAAGQDHRPVADVVLTVPAEVSDPASLTVWARVARQPAEHVEPGDWITVQAYPVEAETVIVDVVPV